MPIDPGSNFRRSNERDGNPDGKARSTIDFPAMRTAPLVVDKDAQRTFKPLKQRGKHAAEHRGRVPRVIYYTPRGPDPAAAHGSAGMREPAASAGFSSLLNPSKSISTQQAISCPRKASNSGCLSL